MEKKAPIAERALLATMDVEKRLGWAERVRFNFYLEYAKQFALIVADDAREASHEDH
jgi:hypothetical protein